MTARLWFYMCGAWLMTIGWLAGWLSNTPPYGAGLVAVGYTVALVLRIRKQRRTAPPESDNDSVMGA